MIPLIKLTDLNFLQFVVQPDEETLKDSPHKPNFGGICLESELFKMLQQTFENLGVEDTVVISGWKDNTPSAKKEFDFLVISLPLKAIIHIEAKRTLIKKSKEKAINQLNDGHSIMKNKVPVPEASNWSYTQYICYCFKDEKDEEILQFLKSQSHFQSQEGQLCSWWKDLISQTSKVDSSVQECKEDTETYLNILKYLVHQMFIQEEVLTQGNLFTQADFVAV